MNVLEWFAAVDGNSLCERWALTLAHFLWQGALIGVVLFLTLYCLRKASARSRYAACLVAQVSLLIAVAATFFLIDIDAQTQAVDVVEPVTNTVTNTEPPQVSEPIAPGNLVDHNLYGPTGRVGSWNEGEPAASNVEVVPRTPVAKPDAQPLSHSEPVKPSVNSAAGFALWITLAYLLCVMGNFLRVGTAIYGGRRLRRSATPITDVDWLAIFASQARSIGLKTVPMVECCERVVTPTVIGLLRPLVLWPTSLMTGLSSDQLALIMRHELAHIRRFDLVANLMQRLIESVLFFHPVVWWMRRQIGIERENCCDDLAAGEHDKVQYAAALLQMAELCLGTGHMQSSRVAAMSAAGESSTHFGFRVRRMLGATDTPRVRATWQGAVLLGVTLLVSVTSLMAFARPEPGEDDKPPVTKPKAMATDEELLEPAAVNTTFTPAPQWQTPVAKNEFAQEMFRVSPVVVADDRILTNTKRYRVADGKIAAAADARKFAWGEQILPMMRRVSSDGKFVVDLGFCDPGNTFVIPASTLRVFRISDGQQIGKTINLEMSSWTETAVDVERGGDFVLLGDRKGVRVYRVKTGEVETTLPVETKRIDAVAFSPDRDWLVVSDQNDLHFWRWRDQAAVKTIHVGRKVDCLKFTPDGQYLAEGPDVRKDIQIRDIRTLKIVASLKDEVGSPLMVGSMDITPDGRYLVANNEVSVDPAKLKIPHRVHVWDLQSQKLVFQVATGEWVRSVAFSADGTQIIGEFSGAAHGALLAAWPMPDETRKPPQVDADGKQSMSRLGDGIQWSMWGDKDGWLSGARLVLPEDGLKPGDPLVIEYRLANVSTKTQTIPLKPHRGADMHDLHSGNQLRFSLNGVNSAPQPLTVKPGEVYVDAENRVSLDTTVLPPGDYTVVLDSAFYYPDEEKADVTHNIPHRGSLKFRLRGESTEKRTLLPASKIHWGEPVAGLQMGAKWVADQNAYAIGATIVADLYIANVSDREVTCSVHLPHLGDGWLYNVYDETDSSTVLKRHAFYLSVKAIPRFIPLKLAPGAITRITGKGVKISMSPVGLEEEPTETTMTQPQFKIVADAKQTDKELPDYTNYTNLRGRLESRGGEYKAVFQVTMSRPDMPIYRLALNTGAVPFAVIGPEWKGNVKDEPPVDDVQPAPKDEAPKVSATTSLPQHVVVKSGSRSAISFHREGKPLLLLYSRDELKSSLSHTANDDPPGWAITGSVQIMRDGKPFQQFKLKWTSWNPSFVEIDGFSVRLEIEKGKLGGAFGTLALSETGALPIARWLHVTDAKSLDSLGKQIDFDVHSAAWYKESRALQKETGAIIEWDTQHPVQHSDRERVSHLRVFPKGRVVAVRNRKRFEGQLTPEELKSLLGFLKAKGARLGPQPKSFEVIINGKKTSVLKMNTWDSVTDIVRFADGDEMTQIACSLGPNEPGDGKWFEPVRKKLNAVVNLAITQSTTGER